MVREPDLEQLVLLREVRTAHEQAQAFPGVYADDAHVVEGASAFEGFAVGEVGPARVRRVEVLRVVGLVVFAGVLEVVLRIVHPHVHVPGRKGVRGQSLQGLVDLAEHKAAAKTRHSQNRNRNRHRNRNRNRNRKRVAVAKR